MPESTASADVLILESADGVYYAVPYDVLEQHRIPEERLSGVRAGAEGNAAGDDVEGFHYSPIIAR
jgi:hypothetical protein